MDLIIVKSVFALFIDSLFTSHHSFIFSSSEFTGISRVLRLFAEANTLVSLAQILKLNLSEHLGKSLIAELLAQAKRARGRSPIAKVIYPSQKIW